MLPPPRLPRFLITLVFTSFTAILLRPLAQSADLRCQIWEDPDSISHLRAQNETGAYACLGYLQARDRGWQMDHLRRIALGRSAEIYGIDSIRTDFIMRLLELGDRARKIEATLPPRERAHFEAYTRGVNAGLETSRSRSAYEFKHFGYQAEPWLLHHSLAILLLQSFEQTRKSFETEIAEAETDPANFDSEFVDDGLPWETSILKPGEFAPGKLLDASTQDERTPALTGQGSNNWVLAPARSKAGTAWLANDPHLDLVHPPFWYWIHLEGGSINVIGSTLPGAPVVSAGSSLHVAWGLTNAYLDVADVELKSRESGSENLFESVRPLIWVKFGPVKLPFFFKKFERLVKTGDPVLPIQTDAGKSAVLHWSGFAVEGGDLAALHDLLIAKSVKEADRAIADAGLPSWNFVFADVAGKIAYRANGRIPRRTLPSPQGFLDAAALQNELWPKGGYLKPSEMPNALNPTRGYVVTANNRQWPALGATYNGGRAYTHGFRALRIEELLLRTPRHDLESLRKMQCDTQAVDARWFVPELLGALEPTVVESDPEHIISELRAWAGKPSNPEYNASLECKPCGFYRRWIDISMETKGGEAGLYRFLRKHPGGLDQRKLVTAAFEKALADVGGKINRWGAEHKISFRHLSKKSNLDGPLLESPGDKHSVNPGTHDWDVKRKLFAQKSGASQRLLVQMTNPPTVYATLGGPNLDLDRNEPGFKPEAWRPWLECHTERRIFPLDWSSLEAGPKTLNQIQQISVR